MAKCQKQCVLHRYVQLLCTERVPLIVHTVKYWAAKHSYWCLGKTEYAMAISYQN